MQLPQHIGIIMDGNGRWARRRGLPRSAGHQAGTNATREIVRACGELGIKYLTIYVFSAENWGRPKLEISFLMDLLVEMISREIDELHANNVRLLAIGDLSRLPEKPRNAIENGIKALQSNSGLTLVLALSYGGRAEIVHAVKAFALEALKRPEIIDQLNEEKFRSYLYNPSIPDPELIIRTGGDIRLSNFLLWQSAYAELYVTNVLWPDFGRRDLLKALEDFSRRERRFGTVKN